MSYQAERFDEDLRVMCAHCDHPAEAHDGGGCTQCQCVRQMAYSDAEMSKRLDEIAARARRLEEALAPRAPTTEAQVRSKKLPVS